MIRVAVVGIGSMGRNHVRVLMDIPKVELVGIADKNLETAESIARKYHIPIFSDYLQLFKDRKPEAVVIAVPSFLHYQIGLAAMERGIHVLMEKPIAMTVQEGEELIAMAARKCVVFGVGHIERFNPAVIELKRRMDAGALGRVFMIHARRQSPFPRRIIDIGVGMDLATHELDMMCYLTGSRIANMSGEVSQVMPGTREDIVFGLLRFENGVLGILDVNWVTPATVREATITGERGMFVVNYLTQELSFFENPAANGIFDLTDWASERNFTVDAGHMTRFQIVKREPLRSELEDFVQAVETGQKSLVDGRAGLQALALALQIVSFRHSAKVNLA